MSVVTSCHVLSALESFLPKLKSFERCRNCMRPRMHFPGTCDCFAQSRCSHALHLREADDILQPFTGAQKGNSHVLVCLQTASRLQCRPNCLSSACICMKRASARWIVSSICTLSVLASCKFWDSKGKLLPDTMPQDATGCHRTV